MMCLSTGPRYSPSKKLAGILSASLRLLAVSRLLAGFSILPGGKGRTLVLCVPARKRVLVGCLLVSAP